MFKNYGKRIFELLFQAKIAQYNKNYIILTWKLNRKIGLFSHWNNSKNVVEFNFWNFTIEIENDQFLEMDFISESNL